MLLMLPQEKLVGHPGNVIANDDVAGLRSRQLFISHRHGAGLIQVVGEKRFKAVHGAIAIFGNRGKIVNMGKEKAFQLGVLSGARIAEARQAARRAADIFDRFDARGTNPLFRRFYQIGRKQIEHTL